MSLNRRRHARFLPVASLLTWVLVATFCGGAGLYFVWCKNQLHDVGSEIKVLEKQLVELQNLNEVAQSRVAKYSSPGHFRKCRAEDKHFLAGYIDIPQDRLVVVGERSASATSDLRPVSNPR